MAKIKAPLSGHETRLAWLKSLKVGDSVTVYRPSISNSCTGCRTERSLICDTGLIVERNKTSVTVEWHDDPFSFLATSNEKVWRKTKLPSFGHDAGVAPCSDRREPNYGLRIFQDVAHLEDYYKVRDAAREVVQSLTTHHEFKAGTTSKEMAALLDALKTCL